MDDRLITKLKQGTDESIVYSITTTSWGSSPTNVIVKGYDVSTGGRDDVSTNILSGSASVSGDVITLPVIQSLLANKTYRIEIKFTSGGNTFEPYLLIQSEW